MAEVEAPPNAPPLEGVVVLELASAMAGPYCGAILRDLGARVIKVERPGEGDMTRGAERELAGDSGYFVGLNRGKEGLSIDLKSALGQEAVRRLVPQVDVVTENFRPGLARAWGLDYETLSALNPSLVYCSVSAYGDAVGLDHLSGHDVSCQAYSGLMDLTGEPDGPPQRLGVPVIDASAAMESAIGILAALRRCDRNGHGEHVSVSLIESAYALMPNYVTTVLNSQVELGRSGTAHPQFAPCEAFSCGDGRYLSLCAFNDRWFSVLCDAVDRPELAGDPRFASNTGRVENRGELHELLTGALGARPRDEWIPLLEERGITAAAVLGIRESLEYFGGVIPGFFQEIPHSRVGRVRMPRSPIRYAERPLPSVDAPAPELGEHTERVLREFGFAPDEVATLREQGLV